MKKLFRIKFKCALRSNYFVRNEFYYLSRILEFIYFLFWIFISVNYKRMRGNWNLFAALGRLWKCSSCNLQKEAGEKVKIFFLSVDTGWLSHVSLSLCSPVEILAIVNLRWKIYHDAFLVDLATASTFLIFLNRSRLSQLSMREGMWYRYRICNRLQNTLLMRIVSVFVIVFQK